jgi:hypothetical protein
MENNIRIFVCTHKPFYMFKDSVLKPIHVGKQLSNLNLGFDGDDTGENISYKNPNYCELTALYWIWKNYSETELVGLCHYRRFFKLNNQHLNKDIIYESDLVELGDLLKITNLNIASNEILVSEPMSFECSLMEQYNQEHIVNDLLKVRESILNLFPDYLVSFDLTMEQNIFYPFNMFITNRNIIDKYCNWLFTVLYNSEKKINISDEPYQRRVFGFLSERLFSVWLYHHSGEIKITHLPVVYFESDYKKVSIGVANNLRTVMLETENLAKAVSLKRILIVVFFKIKDKILKKNQNRKARK